jgi:hypothetical protein
MGLEAAPARWPHLEVGASNPTAHRVARDGNAEMAATTTRPSSRRVRGSRATRPSWERPCSWRPIAKLRNRKFFSIIELNEAIRTCVADLNNRVSRYLSTPERFCSGFPEQ